MNQNYAREAKQRWGETDAYKESERRTAKYSKDDFENAAKAQERAIGLFIEAMDANLSSESTEAIAAAEAHRTAISDWYYECSKEMQVGLTQMYLADARFTDFYESRRVGLAQFVHDSIVASASR
ncbi:MAG: hypothetical protein RL301_765 [Actinomycetota bacterium]|jgi:hypothetical protein